MMKVFIIISLIFYIRVLLYILSIMKFWASEHDKKLLDRAYKRQKALEYIRRKNAKKK